MRTALGVQIYVILIPPIVELTNSNDFAEISAIHIQRISVDVNTIHTDFEIIQHPN
jgi:hypothetical protein